VTNSRQQMRRPRIFNTVKEAMEAQREEVGDNFAMHAAGPNRAGTRRIVTPFAKLA
jgi:hypothetical protein